MIRDLTGKCRMCFPDFRKMCHWGLKSCPPSKIWNNGAKSLLRAFGFNCLRLGTSIHWFQSRSGRSGDRPRHPLSLCGLSVASPSSRQSSFLKMRLLLLGWFAPVSTSIPLQGNMMSQKNGTQTGTVKQSSAGPALVLSSSSHRQKKGTDFLKQVQQSRCIQKILTSLRLLTSGVMLTIFSLMCLCPQIFLWHCS